MNTSPTVKDLVLIGGGHTHVIVLRRFGMRPMPGVRLTVICRELDTPYSGMLPGFVAGHYDYDDVHIDLGPLSNFAGARLYHGEVIGLDVEAREITLANRPPVRFDVASIDVGATPVLGQVDDKFNRVVPVKPISSFVARWQALVARIRSSTAPISIGVVGAGAGGTELVLALQHGLREQLEHAGQDATRLSFHLFASGSDPLESYPAPVRRRFKDILGQKGIALHTGARVEQVGSSIVRTADGQQHDVDEVIWVTEAGAQSWLAESGLEVDENGFVAIQPTLESRSHKGIFAAGDCAALIAHPRPKAGVFAVRQGPTLDTNLRRALKQRPLIHYRPQRNFLSLISTGDQYAIASRGASPILEGAWVWRWKDWIDRRFVQRFNELPEMTQPETPTLESALDPVATATLDPMRCGGCGAKVAADVLDRVLPGLTTPRADEVVIGVEEPDDAAVVRVPAGKLLVQSVDSFRAMLNDPYLFAKIAVNHCLGDLYAMGAEPHTAMAIATLPYATEEKVQMDLESLMQGVTAALTAAGVTLTGGHSGEGAELSLGLAVNGLIDEHNVLRKRALQPGDALIMTKAIGTGVVFAAHMRNRARARWVQSAVDSMLQSNANAADILTAAGARACTDVTGFGVIGHVLEMLRATSLMGHIDISAAALLPGAAALTDAGISSSLTPQNLKLERSVDAIDMNSRDPRHRLLFDPQTAGGLLAGVAESHADDCLSELRTAGYTDARIIGYITERASGPLPVRLFSSCP